MSFEYKPSLKTSTPGMLQHQVNSTAAIQYRACHRHSILPKSWTSLIRNPFEGRIRKLDSIQRFNAAMDASSPHSRCIQDVMETYHISQSYAYELRKQGFAYRKRPMDLEGNWIKIDQDLIHGLILLQRLECQASYSDIRVVFARLFEHTDIPIPSVGKMNDMLFKDALRAIDLIAAVKLSEVKAIAADEIFFGDTPVFTIIDLEHTYTLAIIPMDNRKAETWEKTFADLRERGLNPDIAISDACGSLLKALKAAFPKCNVQLDVFHAIMNLGKELSRIIRKDISDLQTLYKLEQGLSGPRPREATYDKWIALGAQIDDKMDRADTIEILMGWLRELLAFPGYSEEVVKDLIEWILDCLSKCADKWSKAKKQIESFKEALSDDTLKYLRQFFKNLDKVAEEECIDSETLRAVYGLRRYSGAKRNEERLKLEESSGWGPAGIFAAAQLVNKVIRHTPRASSMVENLNSRVRVAINAQRGITEEFCYLLMLYINTKPYSRSLKPERIGKSPYELLTGKKADFFELLGIKDPKHYAIAVA